MLTGVMIIWSIPRRDPRVARRSIFWLEKVHFSKHMAEEITKPKPKKDKKEKSKSKHVEDTISSSIKRIKVVKSIDDELKPKKRKRHQSDDEETKVKASKKDIRATVASDTLVKEEKSKKKHKSKDSRNKVAKSEKKHKSQDSTDKDQAESKKRHKKSDHSETEKVIDDTPSSNEDFNKVKKHKSRKILGASSESDNVSTVKSSTWNDWQTASSQSFGNDTAKSDKFLRLMGAKKATNTEGDIAVPASNGIVPRKNLNLELEEQFQASHARKHSGKRGLGA